MITAFIVDDEQHCINRLKELLQKYFAYEVEVVGFAADTKTAIEKINNLKPQLIFLDVQIDTVTGFDFLQEFKTIPFHIVFTTAYEQYAVKAFKFSAVDYLLKPIDVDDLNAAIKKIKQTIIKDETATKFEVLFSNFKNVQQQNKKITVPTISGLIFLDVQDIIRCQSDINYTTIYTTDKQKILVAKTLKEFEEILSGFNFFRVHNSHLINLSYIKKYNKGKGGTVQLLDNTEIEVSTRRKDEFLQRISLA